MVVHPTHPTESIHVTFHPSKDDHRKVYWDVVINYITLRYIRQSHPELQLGQSTALVCRGLCIELRS